MCIRDRPWACSARYSCQSSASVTPRRFNSAWLCDQSGSVRDVDDAVSGGGNNRRSSSASSISSGIGQLRPATAARRTYSPTAVLPIPVASPTRRRLIPSACVSRSTSRIFLIDTLSAGIGHLLVARKTDQLIRLSTGAVSTPPSPAVRNHRIDVRLPLESVAALHRIPHRNHPLSKAQQNANRKKSRIRVRVEHVFGAQQTSPGGRIVRTIGIERAKAKIGLQNLAYNIRRLVTLERMATA